MAKRNSKRSRPKAVSEENKSLGTDIADLMTQPGWRSVQFLFERDLAKYDTVRGIRSDKEAMRRLERFNALDELWSTIQELADEVKYQAEQAQETQEES